MLRQVGRRLPPVRPEPGTPRFPHRSCVHPPLWGLRLPPGLGSRMQKSQARFCVSQRGLGGCLQGFALLCEFGEPRGSGSQQD